MFSLSMKVWCLRMTIVSSGAARVTYVRSRTTSSELLGTKLLPSHTDQTTTVGPGDPTTGPTD